MSDPLENRFSWDDWQWLIGGPGLSILDRHSKSALEPLKMIRELRRKNVPDRRARLFVEQLELRKLARQKFCQADRMLFERQLLQQATDERLAAYKATRFAGAARIVDGCCGLGGDLMALARVAPATGVDISRIACRLARFNVSANDGDVQVVSSPLDQFPLDEVAWFHLDPDRRSGQRRSVDPRHFSPGADVIEDWIRHFHHGAVKLAPATSHDWHRDYAECQWLGDRNECKQQLVWFGDAARHPGRRSVAAVDDDGRLLFEWTPGDLAEGVRVADPLGEYIYEPHATVLAGDLVDALAFECGLSRIALNVAYLTGSLVEHPALTSFRILEMTRVREKDVLAALKRHGAGWVEVKKRGVSHHLVQRFSGLNLSGDEPRVLILTRHNDRHIALICQRR